MIIGLVLVLGLWSGLVLGLWSRLSLRFIIWAYGRRMVNGLGLGLGS